MMGVKYRSSCVELFKRLQNLTFPCEYVYSLINFITNNEELIQTNADVHSIKTRHKHCLHKPIVNLSCFQKGAYYAGIRIFKGLPSDLKGLMNEKAQFKIALKRNLNTYSFYSVDEYLLCRK
jgi:hypothetical protein